MKSTKDGHCQAFKRDGSVCRSQTGLGIIKTSASPLDGGRAIAWRWACCAHRSWNGTWQGRARMSDDVGDWDDVFVWYDVVD